MKTNTAIDLFAGCGGLTLGLKRAGYRVVAAVEKDVLAGRTYRWNNKSTKLYVEDIAQLNSHNILLQLGIAKGELDLLAGCPPCQSFSVLKTKNGLRHVEDAQSDLIFYFLDFVKCMFPKNIMLENVPGLIKNPRIDCMISQLESLNYECKVSVFDAQQFGVPQRRKRMILLASRIMKPTFPEPTNKKFNVKLAIGNLCKPEESSDPLHNYKTNHSERTIRIISAVPKDGGSRTELPDELKLGCHSRTTGFGDVYGRMSWNSPSPTITGGCINPSKGRFIHPEQDRAITLREASILQGFPENYKFDLSKGRYAVAQMIGNSFPPEFAKMQALELLKRPSSAHVQND